MKHCFPIICISARNREILVVRKVNDMLPSYYHERQRKKKQKMLFGIAVVAIFVIGAITIAVMMLDLPSAADVLNPMTRTVLAEDASIEMTTLYSCGHSKTRLLPVTEELRGKTSEEIKLVHPDWSIRNFTERLLVAEQTLSVECDDHFLLFLKENKIVVSKSKDTSQIITEQEINVGILTEEDKQILSSGIFISSEYELLEILESFQ